MKKILGVSLLAFSVFLFFTATAFADHRNDRHNKHGNRKGGVEWGVAISPYGFSIGVGSRGVLSGGGSNILGGAGNYYYAPPPAMMYAPPRTPAYLPRPFCTNGNAYYFPDGAIIGNTFLPPGTTVPPGICYY